MVTHVYNWENTTMRNFAITVLFTIIMLGIIAFTLNMITQGTVITYLTEENINGITIYIFDLQTYANNVRTSITSYYRLTLEIPTEPGFAGVNYMILIINVLMYPLRVGGYLMKNVLAIIGINMQSLSTNPLKWLVDFVNTLTSLTIAYIY